MSDVDAMRAGFLLASLAWTVWWNLDWRRFIKFYGINGPPYRRWVVIVFRIFFAACFFGAAQTLAAEYLRPIRSPSFYRDVAGFAAVWFAAILLAVKTVEWLSSKRKLKREHPR
jgi:hypothetical protein